MMRPTPKAAILFGASIPPALLAVTLFPESWHLSLYLPVVVLAFMAADLSMVLPWGRLFSEWQVPPMLFIGEKGRVRLSLFADGYSRQVLVEALPELTGEVEEPLPARGMLVNSRLELELCFTPRRRGQIRLEAVWLRWRGPLGLVELRRRRLSGLKTEVLPDIRAIHETALQFFDREAVYGVKTQHMRGEGTEFYNLCEYAPGMDSRSIDWKQSARHRKFLCKEFRQERNHQIVFGFDTGRLMLEPVDGMPRLDQAIRAALLLGWISLRYGDLVGGCSFDARLRGFIKPGRGMPYFTQFQRFSSALAYRTEETNFTLGLSELYARLQRRALVILFTEFVDAISAELMLESLRLLLKRHLVIFVTMRDPLLYALRAVRPADFADAARAVLADDFLHERVVVLERVARLGVHCLDVSAAGVSSALVNRYLLIKQRGLL
jgi:uncharacterized protein (DUF58 family)